MNPRVLATDLDGTFIPLEGDKQNLLDLEILRDQLEQQDTTLVYVSGRHLAIIEDAIREHDLPQPDWIIGNVGTAIYGKNPEGWTEEPAYHQHLASLCGEMSALRLQSITRSIEGLILQEQEKLSEYKVSFYTDPKELDELVTRITDRLAEVNSAWTLISSIDPFTGDGLIDLLPHGVSKALAIQWWCDHHDWDQREVVYAGDSGNDLAALTAGYRAIVVGNADRRLAKQVRDEHEAKQWSNRMHLAEAVATSGVLEGCRAFGLLPESDQP
ncbi:MAG: HAD-IIB family hydrolase [Planctomycetaceae bacterium]|nr:HAD-IIB family hydrolase [Planctomycetaceae bacterium]